MAKLILMRHGQSQWNQANLFTGWVDVPLTPKGIEEAIEAGHVISSIPIDVIYTSTLIRAQMTAMLAAAQHEAGKTPVFLHEGEGRQAEWSKIYSDKTSQEIIPVYRAWQLNERMYGELQGQNKDEAREKFGEDQVHIWRRSFDVPPPNGESLKMTAERTLPYFRQEILPHLQEGKNVLISAHGNSLRSIVMELDGLSQEEVVGLEIPTGKPMIYDFVEGKLQKQGTL